MLNHQYISQIASEVSEPQVKALKRAANILSNRFCNQNNPGFTSASDSKAFLSCKLAQHTREVFAVMFLNNQHQLLKYEELFQGTIDACSVYPRVIASKALAYNAAAVILAHNHPSGMVEPSQADRRITERIQQAMQILEISVLDHIIVGDGSMSFAERGMM